MFMPRLGDGRRACNGSTHSSEGKFKRSLPASSVPTAFDLVRPQVLIAVVSTALPHMMVTTVREYVPPPPGCDRPFAEDRMLRIANAAPRAARAAETASCSDQ